MTLKNFLSSAASLFAFQDLKPNFKVHPGATPTRRKAPLRIDRFADELPYAQFEESDKLCAVAGPDGTFEGIGFVIEVTPQTGTSLNMAKSLEHMIGSILPDGTGVQVSLFGSPFIDPLVDLVRSQTLRRTPEDTPARAAQKDLLSAMTLAKAKPQPKMLDFGRHSCKGPFRSTGSGQRTFSTQGHGVDLKSMALFSVCLGRANFGAYLIAYS